MTARSRDRFTQAQRDLESARWQFQGGFHEWVCFTCQQATEKAAKALYQRLHAVAWGHAVSRLLNELPDDIKPDQELIEAAIRLDRHYIPTRYPNGFERGRLFLNSPISIDVLPCTPAEVEAMRREGNLLLAQIEREKVRLA